MIDRLIDSPLSSKDYTRLEKFYNDHIHLSYYDLYDLINHYMTKTSSHLYNNQQNSQSFDSYIKSFCNEEVKLAILRNYLELFLEYLQYVNYHNSKVVDSLARVTNLVANKSSMSQVELTKIYEHVIEDIDRYPEEIITLDIFKNKQFSKALVYGKILAYKLNSKDNMMKILLMAR